MSKNKNILFLLLALPDMDKTANLWSDLVEEFVARGESIYVVAPSTDGGKTHISQEKGIDVLRVETLPLFGTGVIRKGIANVLLPYQFSRAIRKFFKGVCFDTIIIPTPPITLEKTTAKLKRKFGAKVYLVLRDIFPQNAVDLGMMTKHSPLYKFFRAQERRLYAISDYIGCMSQGNIDYVKEHNPEVAPEKLHILMNFQKVLPITDRRTEDMKTKYGLGGKFVIVFGGNISVPQKIENVVAFAKAIQNRFSDVVVFFVGQGTQKGTIEQLVAGSGVRNIVVKSTIPRDEYNALVAQCDVGLISLDERFTIPNIPSKMMGYLEAGISVLASIDKATDLGTMLTEYDMGLWSSAGNTSAMVDNFVQLYNDSGLRKEMGANGRRFLEEHMRIEQAYEIIKQHIE